MYALRAEHAFGLEEICLCGSFPVGSKWPIIYSYLINTLYCRILKTYCHKNFLAFSEYTILFRLILFLYLEPGFVAGPAILYTLSTG